MLPAGERMHDPGASIVVDGVHLLAIPADKTLHNIHKYGNTTAATVPLLWDECVREGRLAPGDLVLMVAFGAGMHWGATLLRA